MSAASSGGLRGVAVLLPFVHAEVGATAALLYNTLTGKVIEINESDPNLSLVTMLVCAPPSRMLVLDHLNLGHKATELVEYLVRENFISVVSRMGNTLPCAFAPALNVQGTPEGLARLGEGRMPRQPLDCVVGLDIVLTTGGLDALRPLGADCSQTFWPRNAPPRWLDINDLWSLLFAVQGTALARVRLTGTAPYRYPEFAKVCSYIASECGVEPECIVHVSELDKFNEFLRDCEIDCSWILAVPAECLSDSSTRRQIERTVRAYDLRVTVSVADENDLSLVEKHVHVLPSEFDAVPILTESNGKFVRSFLEYARRDVTAERLDHRDVLRNTTLNAVAFGNLQVYETGAVHSGPAASAIGTLGKDKVSDLVQIALRPGSAWRSTRLMLPHCRSCAWRALCPPVSAFEMVANLGCLCVDGPLHLDTVPGRDNDY